MKQIATIGLDIAKAYFQVHGITEGGEVAVRKKCRFRSIPATNSDLIPATDSDRIPATHSDSVPATNSDRNPATPMVVAGFAGWE